MEVKITKPNDNGSIEYEKLNILREAFSIDDPNPRAKIKHRRYAITPLGRFEIGLLGEIGKHIVEFSQTIGADINVSVSDSFLEAYKPTISYSSIQTIEPFEYYEYQIKSLECMFSRGRGIILVGTSGGKGLIMAGFNKTVLHDNPSANILVLAPTLVIFDQLYKEFKDAKLPVTRWGDGNKPDFTKQILLSTYTSLIRNLKKSVALLKDYDYVLVDECHLVKKGNKIGKLISHIKTYNKFGFTGTLPTNTEEDVLDRWNAIGKLGPVLYKIKTHELRDDYGSVSDVCVKAVKLMHRSQPKKYVKIKGEKFRPSGQYDNETEFVYERDWRNNFVSSLANRLKGNCLVLVDRIEHGLTLKKFIEEDGDKQVRFVQGATPTTERQAIKQLMETNNDVVTVAMDKIFSTGLSIKNLKYLIFVCIGKSESKVLQSIGRLLRLHDDKEMTYVFDISDNTKYSADHFADRLKFYKEEKIRYEISKIKENR